MEVLKQGQYHPVPVEKQVMIIYAAVNGHLEGIPVEEISSFEQKLYEFMDKRHPSVGQAIIASGELSKESERMLIRGIRELKKELGYIG